MGIVKDVRECNYLSRNEMKLEGDFQQVFCYILE
jgi:hypothetical protein